MYQTHNVKEYKHRGQDGRVGLLRGIKGVPRKGV